MTDEPVIKRSMLDTAMIKANQACHYFELNHPGIKDLKQAHDHLKDALDLTKAMLTAIDHNCYEVMDRPIEKPAPGPSLFTPSGAPAPAAEVPEVPAEIIALPKADLPALGCIDVELVSRLAPVDQAEQDDFEALPVPARAEKFEATIDLAQPHFQGTPEEWNALSDAWMKAFEAQNRAGETEAWMALENHLRAGSTTFELPLVCTECGIVLVDDEAATMECDICSRERETRNEAAKLAKPGKKAAKGATAVLAQAAPREPDTPATASEHPYPGGTGDEQFSAFNEVLNDLEDRFCDAEGAAGRKNFGDQLKAFRPHRKAWRAAWEKGQLAAWEELHQALHTAKTVPGAGAWSPAKG